MLHKTRTRIRGLRRHQQVHVVGHQTKSMDQAPEARGEQLEITKIRGVIDIGEEAPMSIYSALNDVQRKPDKHRSRGTSHGR